MILLWPRISRIAATPHCCQQLGQTRPDTSLAYRSERSMLGRDPWESQMGDFETPIFEISSTKGGIDSTCRRSRNA